MEYYDTSNNRQYNVKLANELKLAIDYASRRRRREADDRLLEQEKEIFRKLAETYQKLKG